MRQIEILTTIGEICRINSDNNTCHNGCPLDLLHEPNGRNGCAIDFLEDKKIAKQVLKVVKEYHGA